MKGIILVLWALSFLQVLAHPVEDTSNFQNGLVEKLEGEKVKGPDGWCGSGRSASRSPHSRQKRYVIQGSRWKVNPVTYNVTKYPPPEVLARDIIDRDVDAGFRMWGEISNLTFKRAWEGKVNIDIRFETLEHGDDEAFDGRGGMTAHAFYPSYGGSIHFDADEEWTSKTPVGINFFQVATHEIGHALGLEHSDAPGAVMSPLYMYYNINFQLHRDDIEGIQKIYGKKSYSKCEDSKIDAGLTMVDGFVYLFKGNLVYKMKNFDTPVDPEYPKEISKAFENMNGPLDAAFTRSNGVSYFFKGDNFWRFRNMEMDQGFPKPVSDFFPGIPTPIDAAVVFPKDDNIYFMKGSYYWKFDHTKNPSVSTDYPKPLSEWKGIPTDLDGAVRLEEDGQPPSVFFFKGNQYWKFNDGNFMVYLTDPPYPRKLTNLFLPGCSPPVYRFKDYYPKSKQS